MISKVQPTEFSAMLNVINNAAQAYKSVIPVDVWKETYMSAEELKAEIDGGVQFFGWKEKSTLMAVMGIQRVKDVTLIRHAYVLTSHQRQGLGENLLHYLVGLTKTPTLLVGTWTAAWWAIKFYQKHEFKITSTEEKNRLLHTYWNISERQVETSVVLKRNVQVKQ